jgi:hypothetical protein
MATDRDLKVLGDFVLDVLKYDWIEQVANALEMLNSRGSVGWRLNWPADSTDEEIIETAHSGMREPARLDETLWSD